MELSNYPLYCHWGGKILQSSGVVTYKGGGRKFGFVNSQMSYDEGLSKVYDLMICDSRYVELKLLMSEHISELTSPTQTPHVEATNVVGVDSDVDEDEDTENANDKAIRESASSQVFNNVAELDPMLLDSCRTWSNNDFFDGEFAIGQEFDSLEKLKDILKAYSIATNHSFKVLEGEPTKYIVKWKRKSSSKCSWRLRAIKHPCLVSFRIVRYNGPHASNCLGDINSTDHHLLSSDFVCNVMRDLISADPSLKIRVIVQAVKDKFQYTITYKRAWSTKQMAIASIFCDWEKSYKELSNYMQALKESNPGTVVEPCTLPSKNPSFHIFLIVFWAFKPSIDGFKHCRPLITIDGIHLYGKYKGTLLIAMSINANFQLFPLAVAIVENENGESWKWFMKCIRHLVTPERRLAGFYGVHRLVGGGLELDKYLITALIERWRQETHFSFGGEANVTLQEVDVLLGLKVGCGADLVEELLGIRLEPVDDAKLVLQGSSLKMT
ncbi:uncharacterized protein [Spinacia oleracea]|uniref:Transposase MuDR plant domain-containing protein n=1 Tax=Spinacia oleracea TaxID=3562 RepID=A0ABM3QXF4_SPIOL|nr:uncharacterized protein LOC130463054 [Spinacia oleracea]